LLSISLKFLQSELGIFEGFLLGSESSSECLDFSSEAVNKILDSLVFISLPGGEIGIKLALGSIEFTLLGADGRLCSIEFSLELVILGLEVIVLGLKSNVVSTIILVVPFGLYWVIEILGSFLKWSQSGLFSFLSIKSSLGSSKNVINGLLLTIGNAQSIGSLLDKFLLLVFGSLLSLFLGESSELFLGSEHILLSFIQSSLCLCEFVWIRGSSTISF
jgi:hypothetical protein